MTDDEIEQAWQLVNRYGPSNAWTGTTGPLAAALGRALKEIEKLKACRSHWLEFVEEPKHGNK